MANADYMYHHQWKKNFFQLTHDENMHAGIHRCFNRIIDIFYIPCFLLNIVLIVDWPKRKNTDFTES